MASFPNLTLRLPLLALTLLMSGCSLMPDYPARYLEAPMRLAAPEESTIEQSEVLARLYQQYSEWRGVKYKKGGMSKKGIDCSGFVKQSFDSLFNIKLPRDTLLQARTGTEVEKGDLRSGDLLFFRINKRTQHVGIYLEQGRFMHASSSSGVMISSLELPYWQSRYWKALRHNI